MLPSRSSTARLSSPLTAGRRSRSGGPRRCLPPMVAPKMFSPGSEIPATTRSVTAPKRARSPTSSWQEKARKCPTRRGPICGSTNSPGRTALISRSMYRMTFRSSSFPMEKSRRRASSPSGGRSTIALRGPGRSSPAASRSCCSGSGSISGRSPTCAVRAVRAARPRRCPEFLASAATNRESHAPFQPPAIGVRRGVGWSPSRRCC